jgi:hypothetical protein
MLAIRVRSTLLRAVSPRGMAEEKLKFNLFWRK